MAKETFTRKAIFAGCLLLIFCCACQEKTRNWDKSSPYLYEDTKCLVMLVEDAAELMEQQGAAAFADFERKGSARSRKAGTDVAEA